MPLPERLRSPGEEVVVDVRPHACTLAGPVFLALVGIAAVGAAAAVGVSVALGWVLIGVLALVLVHLVVRYLRWRGTNLVVTSERLIRRNGVLSRRSREIPLAFVSDLSYRQSLLGRMVGAGDLVVDSVGPTGAVVFTSLAHPAEVQRDIARLMVTRRIQAGTGRPSLPEQLEQLADLRERGILNDAEFESTKARLLRGRWDEQRAT